MHKMRYGTIARPSNQERSPDAHSLSSRPLHDEGEKDLGIKHLHSIARAASLSVPGWHLGCTRGFLDGFIESTPNDITVYPIDKLHLAPDNHISILEVYFLGQLEDLPPHAGGCPEGALLTHHSTKCLRDSIRTKKFLLGVRDAVKKLESERDEIRVCDAGCGAIPIQAIYAALCSERVHGIALELNSWSADIARMIVDRLGLAKRIDVIEADAIKYTPMHGIDLLVSETMQSGLTAEPLVQIMSNLSTHVTPRGIILPSRVSVMAALGSVEEYKLADKYVSIGGGNSKVMKLDWKMVTDYIPGAKLDRIEARFSTSELTPGYYFAVVTSEVEIGTHMLGMNQSAITVPQIAREAKGEPMFFCVGGGRSYVEIRYAPGELLNAKAAIVPW